MKCRLCGKDLKDPRDTKYEPFRGLVHTECVEANTRAAQAGGRR